MIVHVQNHYTDETRTYEGTEAEIEHKLALDYPWLNSMVVEDHGDLAGLLERLNDCQAYSVGVGDALGKSEDNLSGEGETAIVHDMLGYSHAFQRALAAAQFLAGGKEADDARVRQALYDADGDYDVAALLAHGIEADDKNVAALRAVYGINDVKKDENAPVQAREIVPGTPEAAGVAASVRRSFAENWVLPVALAGRHSQGSLLARDENSKRTFLLKPGSGKQSPAAGAAEESASQSKREACFYQIAKALDLDPYLPETQLLLIDGKEYAAMALLPFSYTTLERRQKQDPGLGQRLLKGFLQDGILHKWAVIDYVLGNPDRHGQNIMVGPENQISLIDHGSAFAGPDFDPANDRYSFVPYYLRAWAPSGFNKLSGAEKMRYLPRVHDEVQAQLMDWLFRIDQAQLRLIMARYGINPQPSLDRLARLRAMAVAMPADEAVNRLWAYT